MPRLNIIQRKLFFLARSNPHRTTTMNYTIIYALKAWASDALAQLKREREAVYG